MSASAQRKSVRRVALTPIPNTQTIGNLRVWFDFFKMWQMLRNTNGCCLTCWWLSLWKVKVYAIQGRNCLGGLMVTFICVVVNTPSLVKRLMLRRSCMTWKLCLSGKTLLFYVMFFKKRYRIDCKWCVSLDRYQDIKVKRLQNLGLTWSVWLWGSPFGITTLSNILNLECSTDFKRLMSTYCSFKFTITGYATLVL